GRCRRWRPQSRPAGRNEGLVSPSRWIGLRPAAFTTQPDRVMHTEQISSRYVDLDSWSAAEMIAAMYEGQLAAAAAVRGALDAIAAAVDDAVLALQQGGRIVYAGA